MSKRVFQVVFFAFAAYGAYLASNDFNIMNDAGYFPPGIVRLHVLELRGGGATANTMLSLAGLLENGCQTKNPSVSEKPVNVNGTFSLGATPANGYFFVSGSNFLAQDPIRWVVEVSSDNGSTWTPVGASVWRIDPDGVLDLHPDLPYATPLLAPGAIRTQLQADVGTGTEVRADERPPLSWGLTQVALNVYYPLGFLTFALLGLFGQARLIRAAWLTLLVVDGIFNTAGVAEIAFSEPSMWREAVETCLYLICWSVLINGSIFYERKFILVLFVYSLVTMVMVSSSELSLYKRHWNDVLLQQLTSLTFVALIFCTAAFIFRKRASARAQNVIVADRHRYDAAWDVIKADPAAGLVLSSMSDETRRMMQGADQVARQVIRLEPREELASLRTANSWMRAATCLLPGYLRPLHHRKWGKPVQSLDQLYVQAWCLNPILRRKVQKWALQSNGCFAVRRLNGEVAFISFAQVKDNESVGMVRWPNVKSTSRAIEKLVRVYDQVAE